MNSTEDEEREQASRLLFNSGLFPPLAKVTCAFGSPCDIIRSDFTGDGMGAHYYVTLQDGWMSEVYLPGYMIIRPPIMHIYANFAPNHALDSYLILSRSTVESYMGYATHIVCAAYRSQGFKFLKKTYTMLEYGGEKWLSYSAENAMRIAVTHISRKLGVTE